MRTNATNQSNAPESRSRVLWQLTISRRDRQIGNRYPTNDAKRSHDTKVTHPNGGFCCRGGNASIEVYVWTRDCLVGLPSARYSADDLEAGSQSQTALGDNSPLFDSGFCRFDGAIHRDPTHGVGAPNARLVSRRIQTLPTIRICMGDTDSATVRLSIRIHLAGDRFLGWKNADNSRCAKPVVRITKIG